MTIYVNFTDSTETVISAVFGCPQNATTYPNQGSIDVSDARYAAYYATLPPLVQANLPAPTTPAAPSLAQQAAALIDGGITITSTGTPALNGTYAVASGIPFGREDIGTEAQFVSTFSEFTNETTTLKWPLLNGTFVTFPNTAAFMNFAKVAAQFYAACSGIAALGTGTLPAATATIP